MLVIQISIGSGNLLKTIDEIHVQNDKKVNSDVFSLDLYEYRIRRPFGFSDVKILHKRSDGARELTRKVLEVLNETS